MKGFFNSIRRYMTKLLNAILALPIDDILESDWLQLLGKEALDEFVRLAHTASTKKGLDGKQKRDWVLHEMKQWAIKKGHKELLAQLENDSIKLLIQLIYDRYVKPEVNNQIAVG